MDGLRCDVHVLSVRCARGQSVHPDKQRRSGCLRFTRRPRRRYRALFFMDKTYPCGDEKISDHAHGYDAECVYCAGRCTERVSCAR